MCFVSVGLRTNVEFRCVDFKLMYSNHLKQKLYIRNQRKLSIALCEREKCIKHERKV